MVMLFISLALHIKDPKPQNSKDAKEECKSQ
jgi:hypothetical protein